MFTSKLNKYQKNYDYLVNILKSSDIDTKEKVETHLKSVLSRAVKFSLIVIAVIALLCVLLPKYIPIWGILAVLILTWAWASALSARKIMKDYISKELEPDNS
jgi:ABC-type transport system involved in cytochrome bd biosynthesis fused ATPase/permease subunit